MTRKSRKEI